MTMEAFLAALEEVCQGVTAYEWGSKGRGGKSDCIGIIIGAVEKCGAKWEGVHGSNWWARNYTRGLVQVTEPEDLAVGDLIYKARAPGANGYDLPGRYRADPDQRDYYHVGVVTGVEPLEITHCSTLTGDGGIYRDNKLGRWAYKGKLTLIDGVGEEPQALAPGAALVTAKSGATVRLRAAPKKQGKTIQAVPLGTPVEVLEVEGDWARIRVPVEGYMMAEFLRSP